MKTINVVAAIIIKDNKIFATQRGYGDFKGGWEFPGGKIEENELPRDAIIREIKEELNIDIIPGKLFETIEYNYPTFHLSMQCFISTIMNGDIVLSEHTAAKWLSKEDLDSVEWLKADITIIDKLKNSNVFDMT
jgi:8-oxo-dGTP diphosphatase